MQADVVIVGGGPVGVGLAIDLAINGVSCIIVERHDSIQRIPKGQNLTPRTGEHFRRWGVTGAIRGASPIPRSKEAAVPSSCAPTAVAEALTKQHQHVLTGKLRLKISKARQIAKQLQ